ncbi:hypothetical protein BDP55DRAFT_15851 [Colletotrichum godetiae]|uniref:Uncharacterized protein n=1 Tax=Colletotrichum godetiae TaxID=1209918 RepID=A0AAJ0AZR2_9PEZI|nr:uncharacterized protein BDP55DRAFT_15851 [Colletotrichum godetiae]KAK1701284.1 hypothetical protein BDP55DRAFT_15851 [Colletotrichum godetiae]
MGVVVCEETHKMVPVRVCGGTSGRCNPTHTHLAHHRKRKLTTMQRSRHPAPLAQETGSIPSVSLWRFPDPKEVMTRHNGIYYAGDGKREGDTQELPRALWVLDFTSSEKGSPLINGRSRRSGIPKGGRGRERNPSIIPTFSPPSLSSFPFVPRPRSAKVDKDRKVRRTRSHQKTVALTGFAGSPVSDYWGGKVRNSHPHRRR